MIFKKPPWLENCKSIKKKKIIIILINVIFCVERINNSYLKYLGVDFDRSLIYKKHIDVIEQKLKTRNNILTNWLD